METDNNHDHQEHPGKAPEESQEKRHFDSCADAFRAGKEDATQKAKEAAPKLKQAVADALFDVAYGATYGAVFAGAFANEFVPQSVREAVEKGVAKGAAAGRSAADKVRARKESEETATDGGDTLELPAPA